jgi:hypothetical protein
MGSPLSPILADLYMERMEKRIREEDTEGVIKFWKRYVDYVLAIISTRGNPTMILEQANSISATDKLTLEREKNGRLPFLDVKIMREGNKLNTSVYRKAADSGRYLNFNSNHPRSVKVGVASCLLLRAETHCSDGETKSKETKHMKTTLKNIGYPSSVFREIERKKVSNELKRRRSLRRW